MSVRIKMETVITIALILLDHIIVLVLMVTVLMMMIELVMVRYFILSLCCW